MTRVHITVQADMRCADLAADNYERIARVLEDELQAIDSATPTLGRPGERGPAEVSHLFVRTEHGRCLGRAGRGEGWAWGGPA